MNSNRNFMLRAIELSINSAQNTGGPFGCVIVKNDDIISEAKVHLVAVNKNGKPSIIPNELQKKLEG